MTKQSFLGLVKISGDNWTSYESAKDNGDGKLIFADIKSEGHVGKYIYANGIEYKVADSTNLDALINRVSSLESSMGLLEAWKVVVDGSIADLDASVKNHETRINALEDADDTLADRIADVSQDVIDISTYVHVTVNASIEALQDKDTEIDASITDISTRLSNVAITAADNSIGVNNSSIALKGDNYVSLTAANNTVTVGIKESALAKGIATGSEDVSLATKGYVDEQISVLEQALVFKGSASSDASLPIDASAGWTYVADASWNSDKTDEYIESGDLIIRGEDSWIVVERNLDGAVTANTALDSSHLVVGAGNQGVATINVTAEDLATAIANANSAIQNVSASATQNTYVTISVEDGEDPSTKDVSAVLTVVDTSAKLAAVGASGSLVDALAVKEFVKGEIAAIPEVAMTLDSSTPAYVTTSATVSNGAITAKVGVVTATLADASNNIDGLATAQDVYTELTKVEEVMATSVTTMTDTLGLDSSLSVTWSAQSGIPSDATYKEAIEGAYAAAHEAGVTSFGDKTGAISIDTATGEAGDIKFAMDGSTLTGAVEGWDALNTKVIDIDASIADLSTRMNTAEGEIDALQSKDVEIDASINRLDTSVSALESWADNTLFVNTLSGEETINGSGDYVSVIVDQSTGDVKLTSEVKLADTVNLDDITDASAATATGLATDATVKDYVAYALAWEVIE